jgi:hypothetical protein
MRKRHRELIQSPDPTGKGVRGSCLSAPGVRGGSGEGTRRLLGCREWEPSTNGGTVGNGAGSGGLKGVTGDMRRGSMLPWKRVVDRPRVVLCALRPELPLALRE